MLSWIYSHEYGHGFNARPGSLDRALTAAQRAVELAPSNHLAFQALAVARFFRQEKASCLSAAERALALNPLDGSNEAMFLIAFTGDWERGCSLIRRAMDLNPHHPGWYRLVLALNAYRTANYRDALNEAARANAPGLFWTNMMLAAAHAQLGELDSARGALTTLLAQKEDFAESGPATIRKWYQTELADHLIDGLRKAGLDSHATAASPRRTRVDEGFWVAVLPFKYRGANPELEALADGLSEEIVTGLSRFSYLRVIARGSSEKHASESGDVRAVGQVLGDFRRASVGRDLRSSFPCRRHIRVAGRPRPANRLHARRLVRRTAPQHERSAANQGLRPADAVRGSVAQLRLRGAPHS
jgi:tetratricopeptide (TPR) repeat protein